MGNVCGCTPASSAATEMMYSARSWSAMRQSHSQIGAGVFGHGRGDRLDRSFLLVGEALGNVDHERHEEITRVALGRLDAATLHLLGRAALGAGLHLQRDRRL